MDETLIYKKVENYVVDLFEKTFHPALIYHNLNHTRITVNHTKEIAGHYDLNERNMLVVYVAAWFHDTGYLFADPAVHEEKSCELMRTFMQGFTTENGLVEEIEDCIMATKPGHMPNNLCEEILKDADTYHLGTKDFKGYNRLVIAENKMRDPNFSQEESDNKVLHLLQHHEYFTSYCRGLLNEGKQKNIAKLKKKIMKVKEHEKERLSVNKEQESAAAAPEKSSALVTKGIQTMLRLTSENHMRLSDMADNKANILISVNAIIISVIFAVLLRRLSTEGHLTIPTIIFLLVAVTTIVISILATRPKIVGGEFTQQDIIDKKTNLLFFGNFHKVSYEQYELAMRQMMKDPSYLYGSLVKDIYYLGVVLARKYKLIRLAYNIFMIGIIISVLAFAIATFFSSDSGVITNASGTPL